MTDYRAKNISVLGSTGSIGRQSLEVIAACGMSAAVLTANTDVKTMEEQARRFAPELVVMADERAAADLKVRLADTSVQVASGQKGVMEAAQYPAADTVLVSIVGIAGLRPTLSAVRGAKRVALANKESLVCAGEMVLEEARDYGSRIYPVDSEHSAIFQCLESNKKRGEVRRLLLTCSGGPFYGMKAEQLKDVTREDALQHPNWNMGAKITVDSATLMNKGLELMEAMHLFGMPPEKISIVVHRESIIHSMVEYCDNAILAQLGAPDMRLPIQYALTWPERIPGPSTPLDMTACPALTFGKPDLDSFPCLTLAIQAAKQGGNAGAVLSGANEAAVELFLAGKIGFLEIPELVQRARETVPFCQEPSIEDILNSDAQARQVVFQQGK